MWAVLAFKLLGLSSRLTLYFVMGIGLSKFNLSFASWIPGRFFSREFSMEAESLEYGRGEFTFGYHYLILPGSLRKG